MGGSSLPRDNGPQVLKDEYDGSFPGGICDVVMMRIHVSWSLGGLCKPCLGLHSS